MTTPTIVKTSDLQLAPRYIPLAFSENTGQGDNPDLIQFITISEREFLRSALGPSIYATLLVELEKFPINGGSPHDPAAPEYIELVEGDGDEWQGLNEMLVDYVYCKWLNYSEVNVNLTGVGKPQSKSHSAASVSHIFVERWNIFMENFYEFGKYLDNSDTFERYKNFPFFEFENSLGI